MYSSGDVPVAHSIASDAIKREPVTTIAPFVVCVASIAVAIAVLTEIASMHSSEYGLKNL